MFVDLSIPNFNKTQLHQMKRFYFLNKQSIGVSIRLKNLVIFEFKNNKKRCVFMDKLSYGFVLEKLA